AYVQLTTRYKRDIPELFKYNVFCIISDGVNNKAGSFFAPYEFCNRSHPMAADRLLQDFNCGQGCTQRRILNGLCFETQKRLLAVRGGK
ncbi:MAG: type I restriction endonuclease, partial [Thermodesulfobacteriota bacterium]|nr:type I restriction endonuclease [Thermodesulfobacteriota bacterium]